MSKSIKTPVKQQPNNNKLKFHKYSKYSYISKQMFYIAKYSV